MKKFDNKKVLELYKKGESVINISKIYKISYTPIYNFLKKEGVIRKAVEKRIYSIDDRFFENIDSNEKSYIFGVLMADGNNSPSKNTITISMCDEDIIRYIKNSMKYNGIIKKKLPKKINHKCQYSLGIYSKKISTDLANIGMIRNKTNYCEFPIIENEYNLSFICGYFDGDGSLYVNTEKNKFYISFTGNIKLIKRIREILELEGSINPYLYVRNKKSSNIVTLTYSGSKNVYNTMCSIYRNVDFKMNRKYEKFIELKEFIESKDELCNLKVDEININNEKKKILKNEKVKLILNLYKIDNKSIRDISRITGYRRQTISDILKSNDVIFRSNLFYMK